MKEMKNIFLFIAGLLVLTTAEASCQQVKDLPNLKYGENPQNTLDLFLPEWYTVKTPVIIMLHGGGWMMGGKDYTDKRAKDLRARGFIVANVDYRYVSASVHCNDLLKDIDNAVAYVEATAKKMNFSSSGYHLAGISAGAHLALLYGYTTKRDIRSISALCAPSKFDDAETFAHLQKLNLVKNVELLADDTYPATGKISAKFTAISPYAFIKPIPTLLAHGTKDELVNYQQSVNLYEQLQQKNIKSKLLTMEGKGHDVGMNEPESEKLVYNEITNWVTTYN
jgi:acetyl esterase/lipase